MARFYIIVLVSASLPTERINNTVTEILRPYSYDYKFESFRTPCECVWGNGFGVAKANEEIGEFYQLWKQYNLISDNQQLSWSEYIRDWEEKAIESAKFYRDYKEPDPECGRCCGSGIIATTCYPFYLYEYWVDENLVNLGLAGSALIDAHNVRAIVTPDEQVLERFSYFNRYGPQAWAEKCQSILEEYSNHLAVRCFLYK